MKNETLVAALPIILLIPSGGPAARAIKANVGNIRAKFRTLERKMMPTASTNGRDSAFAAPTSIRNRGAVQNRQISYYLW